MVLGQCPVLTGAVQKALENLFSKHMSLYTFPVIGDFTPVLRKAVVPFLLDK